MTPDRTADLLARYYSEDPPTTEELIEAGVSAEDLAEVFALVQLDLEVQRRAIVSAAQDLALAMTHMLAQQRRDS